MKKFLLSLVGAMIAMVGFASAAKVAKFGITIKPDTFKAGEAVDVRVQALDSDGNVVKDAKNYIYMKLKKSSGTINQDDRIFPAKGAYMFTPEDQGDKTFSKGLIIKKPGTYTFFMDEMTDSAIHGETTITVLDPSAKDAPSNVQVSIASPTANMILDRTTMTVLGTSASPRTPIVVTLNDKELKDSFSTDASGGFTLPIAGLVEGKNKLSVQLKNADGKVLGASETIEFSVKMDKAPLFKEFHITPMTGLVVGQQATATVIVADRVTSAQLLIDGKNTYPLKCDNNKNKNCASTLQFDQAGDYELKVRLYVDGEMTEVDVDDIKVRTKSTPEVNTGTVATGATVTYAIGEVRYAIDPLVPGNVTVSWEPKGPRSPFYTVYYGLDPADMVTSVITSSTGIILTGLSLDKETYVQVLPTTEKGATLGKPSDALVIGFQPSAPKCVIKGIKLRSEKRGSDYYLVRDTVEGAKSYTVFRSENATDTIASMTQVGTTTTTEYRYPFDPKAKHETYAYYAIQANCEGGLTKPVGGIEKVKTGPVSSSLLVLLVVVGLYMLYRVNVTTE